MNKETDLSLLNLFLPEGLIRYFDVVGFDKKPIKDPLYVNRLTIYLEEKKEVPEAYKTHQYKASGFMEPRIVNDYPIRDNLVRDQSQKLGRNEVKSDICRKNIDVGQELSGLH